MSNENQIDESQIPKQNQSIDTIDASKFADAQSQLANLKENYELDRKLNIIKNSELSKLSDFRKFFEYIKEEKNKDKLDLISKAIESGLINDIKQYIDVDSTGWSDILNDDSAYEGIKIEISEKIEKYNLNKKADEGELKADEGELKADEGELKADEGELKADEKKLNLIKILNKDLQDYKDVKDILEKNPELKDIFNKLDETDKDLLDYKNTNDINNAKKSKDEVLSILSDKFVQDRIFEALKKEATETHNTEKIRKIADSFKSLGIIDDDKYKEIYVFADKIDKKEDSNTKSLSDTQKELAVGYSSRGDTLYKTTDKTSFTIDDGKITSVSKSSGLNLTDYNTLDEDGKKLVEKIKLESEIKELNIDLSNNKDKKIVLDRIDTMLHNVKNDDLNNENIKLAIVVIGSKFSLLKNQLYQIQQSSYNPKEKLEYIIRLIYGHITGSTNTFELNGLSLIDQIYITKNKLEIQDFELNKKLQESQKKLDEIKKLFPNLDEKSIQEKIKFQENKMQDTINFCDRYGLSALGHIAYIKQVIKIFLKNEGIELKNDDIGTWTKQEKEKYSPIIKKGMAKLLGKSEDELYKDGREEINNGDKKEIVERGLKDPNSTSNLTSIYNLNNLLRKEVKIKGIGYSSLNSLTGELNINAVDKILMKESNKMVSIKKERVADIDEADKYLETELENMHN